MGYVAWSVVFGEQPTAAKWNILGENDESFNDGTGIADDAIITRHIADGSILSAQMDQDEVGFVVLGRTLLASPSDTITVNPITAMKYLRILVHTLDTGGTIGPFLIFNNDTSTNYANRNQTNGAADATQVSTNQIYITGAAAAEDMWSVTDVINVASRPKLATSTIVGEGSNGAGNAPNARFNVGKWHNTSVQITRVDVINTATGDFNTGSEVIVLGKN